MRIAHADVQVNTSGEDSKSGCAVQVLSLHHHAPPPPCDTAVQEAPTLAQHIISRFIPAALGRCNILRFLCHCSCCATAVAVLPQPRAPRCNVTHFCSCPHLVLKGLMTIGMVDYSPNPQCFARLLQVLL
jgi:hypothetical protein